MDFLPWLPLQPFSFPLTLFLVQESPGGLDAVFQPLPEIHLLESMHLECFFLLPMIVVIVHHRDYGELLQLFGEIRRSIDGLEDSRRRHTPLQREGRGR